MTTKPEAARALDDLTVLARNPHDGSDPEQVTTLRHHINAVDHELSALRFERDLAKQRQAALVEVLARVHALLPPQNVSMDGRTYAFNDPDAMAKLRALGDQIRRIPEEVALARSKSEVTTGRYGPEWARL